MKATLETPLTRLPRAGLVWLEGSAFTTVVTTPAGLTFEMRPPRTDAAERDREQHCQETVSSCSLPEETK